MAGGLFGRQFAFNEKCIIFSLICMGLFLYKPNFKNRYFLYFTLFIIFVIAYVAMSWYDYYFNCDLVPLKRGKKSITGLFKPTTTTTTTKTPTPTTTTYQHNIESERKRHMLIYAMHLLLISPLLAYLAIYGNKSKKLVYPILGALSLFTAGYHGTALMVGSH